MPPVCSLTPNRKKLLSNRANRERTYSRASWPVQSEVQPRGATSNRTNEPDRQAVKAMALTRNVRSKPKTRLESIGVANEPSIFLIANNLFARTRQLTDKYTYYSIFARRHHHAMTLGPAQDGSELPWGRLRCLKGSGTGKK